MAVVKVYGTEWNATLGMVLSALAEDNTPIAEIMLDYLKVYLAPPDTYADIEVDVEIVKLVKSIAPATTLTPDELSYILDECNLFLEGKKP